MTVHPRGPFFPDGDLSTRLHFGRCAADVFADLVTSPWTVVTSAGGLHRAEAAGLFARLAAPHTIMIVPPGLISLADLAGRWKPGPALVVGIGAGSALDAAKLVRLANRAGVFPADTTDWPKNDDEIGERLICVPTTAGSGSELTPTASHWHNGIKSALDGPGLRPTDAVYDPALLVSAPLEIKVAALWDATSHALEALWSRRATDISDHYAGWTLTTIAQALCRSGRVTDRILPDLTIASAAAGAAIAITRTGIAHALSYPLTGRFGVRHGLAAGLYAVAAASLLPECAPERAARIEDAMGPLTDLSALWRATGAGRFVSRSVSAEVIRSGDESGLDPARADLSVIPPEPDILTEIRRRAADLAIRP